MQLVSVINGLKQKLEESGKIVLPVKVRPGAGKNKWKEQLSDGSFKIDIKNPADGGRANEELKKFIAETFTVSRNKVSFISGGRSRQKIIKIMV